MEIKINIEMQFSQLIAKYYAHSILRIIENPIPFQIGQV